MKLSIVSFTLMFFTLNVLYAKDVKSQELAKTSATIVLSNGSLKSAIAQVESQTPFKFAYVQKQVEGYNNITLLPGKRGLEQVLEELFAQTKLDYRVRGNTIVLVEDLNKRIISAAKLFLSVSGVVTSDKGEPLAGVTVMEEGTQNAVVTDEKGRYSINVGENATLEFSYLGYSKKVRVDGQSLINVTLQTTEEELSEVVVVGFGTKKKENLTSAVSTVKMDKVLGNRPSGTAGNLLQGVVPGLQILSGSGEPGAGFSFNIRGTTSINGGEPLVLVDNVPLVGPLNQLNPSDIETVTVLKDAGSSAIYGARAAFGVILITTKKGTKNQKPSITYGNNFAITSTGELPKKANPAQTIQSYKDMGYATYWTGQDVAKWADFIQKYNENPSAYPEGFTMDNGIRYQLQETDALKDIMTNGFQQTHNVAVSGGGPTSAYRVSVGYLNNNGVLITDKDKYKRSTFAVL